MSTEHESNWAGLAVGAPTTASEPTAIRPGLDWPDGRLPIAGSTGRANPVPAWLRFFNSELRLIFGRPRNLALLGVLAIAGVFFGIVLRLTINSGGSGGFPFLNQLAGNGVFLALVMLALTVSLPLLPLAVAVVSGDAIAGEAGHGTLRVLLTVPAGRTRLLVVKYAAIMVFSLAACLLIAVVSLIMGLILFHTGPVTLLSGNTISLGAGVLRVLVVDGLLAVAMTSLGAIGLAASTLTQHPVGAIAGPARAHRGQRDLRPAAAAVGDSLVPADALLAGVGRAVPVAGGLVGHRARAGVVRRLRGDLRRDRLGEADLCRHHQLARPASSAGDAETGSDDERHRRPRDACRGPYPLKAARGIDLGEFPRPRGAPGLPGRSDPPRGRSRVRRRR